MGHSPNCALPLDHSRPFLRLNYFNRLFPKGANDGVSGLGAGKILLSGDQVAIPDGKAAPKTGLNIIGPDRLQLVFDPPGHDMLGGRQAYRNDAAIVSGSKPGRQEQANHGLFRL